MIKFTNVLCSIFMALLFLSADVKADPAQIISGSATVRFGGSSFSLSDANGNSYGGSPIGGGFLPVVQPGSTFNPVANLFNTFGSSDFRGIYSNGNTSYPVVYLNGVGPSSTPSSFLTFASASFQLPVQLLPTFTMQIPFTMQGVLVAVGDCTASFPLCNQLIANNSLAGSGMATYNFFSQNGAWQLSGINYNFENTNPTPEPATLILMGTGLAGIIGYARKRRKKHSD